MFASLAQKWGVLGAFAFLILGSVVLGALAYNIWENIRNALGTRRIDVSFMGQHDESVLRDAAPFKYWFAFGLICLTLLFAIASSLYLLGAALAGIAR